MDIKAIKEYLGNDWVAVQEHITSALRSDIDLLNATNDSILSHSGKQLRPLLTVLFARACNPALAALPASPPAMPPLRSFCTTLRFCTTMWLMTATSAEVCRPLCP